MKQGVWKFGKLLKTKQPYMQQGLSVQGLLYVPVLDLLSPVSFDIGQ